MFMVCYITFISQICGHIHTRARRFPLPNGPGQVKLPVGQVDLDRFFFFISYKQIGEFQNSWSRASEDFEKRRVLHTPITYSISHSYLTGVSSSAGDTCQIWMWYSIHLTNIFAKAYRKSSQTEKSMKRTLLVVPFLLWSVTDSHLPESDRYCWKSKISLM